MKLLQSQKNQVYRTIEKSGLSPNLFRFEESTRTTFLIFKKNTMYAFSFMENNTGSHYAKYSPGYEKTTEEKNPGSWELQLGYVTNWLRYLKREIESPDLWKQLQEKIDDTNFEDIKYDNSKFNSQEYKILEVKIDELKSKISKLDLLEQQVTDINKKLDHLLQMAKDLNKTDWKDLFIGTIISLMLQLSVDKQTGHLIFGYIKMLFVTFLPQIN